MQETEIERVFHPGIPPSNEDEFDIFEQSVADPGETMEHVIEHERVKAICFWRPPGMDAPPIIMSNVHKCSRYTKK